MSEEEHQGPWILMQTGGPLLKPRYWSESEVRWSEDIAKAKVYEDGGDSATIYRLNAAHTGKMAPKFSWLPVDH